MRKLTRIKAIRARCVECADGYKDIECCAATDCALFPLRFGREVKGYKASAAIPKYCRWCCNGSNQVEECIDTACPLYIYRSSSGTLHVVPTRGVSSINAPKTSEIAGEF